MAVCVVHVSSTFSQSLTCMPAAWVQGSTPLRTDSGVGLANLPGPSLVQGSVYWSKKWKVRSKKPTSVCTTLTLLQSYVYISGDGSLGPNFNITTAPNPEGPWAEPVVCTTCHAGIAAGSWVF
jgi:hypothetical protein